MDALSVIALGLAAQGGGGGTTYTAGEGIDITNNEISVDKDKVVTFEDTNEILLVEGDPEGERQETWLWYNGYSHDQYDENGGFSKEAGLDANTGLFLESYTDPDDDDSSNYIIMSADDMAISYKKSGESYADMHYLNLDEISTQTLTAGEGIAINSDNEISALVDGETILFNEDGELTAVGGGSSDFYWCEYGTTTYEEIEEAVEDGKLPIFRLNSTITPIYQLTNGSVHKFTAVYEDTDGIHVAHYTCNTEDNWMFGGDTLKEVSGTNDGTNWTSLTINGTTKAIPSGGGTSYTFTNGLTESSGTVSWDLSDRIKSSTGAKSVIIGDITGNSSSAAKNSIIIGTDDDGLSRGGSFTSTGKGSVAGGNASGSGSVIQASGYGSLAFGFSSASVGALSATQTGSVALGYGVQANATGQIAVGKCNITDNTKAFIIGNGTNNTNRSNALTVDWNGNLVCNNIPAPPSEDGEYDLHCSIVDGAITYSWTARE